MDKQRVLDALETLKAELAGAKEIDPQTRENLERMASDIESRMQDAAPPATDDDDNGLLSGQLQEVVQEFGAEHPRLAGAINHVAAALANLGI